MEIEIESLLSVALEDSDLVLLDLDNTLYPYRPCHEKAIAAVENFLSAHYTLPVEKINELYMVGRKKTGQRLKGTAASHGRLFYLQYMIETLESGTNTALTAAAYDLYWNTYMDAMELFPDAIPFLERCREREVMVVLVTDMIADTQFRKIGRLGIQPYIRFVVSSEEAGIEKPDQRIFAMGIEKAMRVKPSIERITVVGDDAVKDNFRSDEYMVSNFLLKRR